MSNSALLKSSISKKYWMALTGLFLCTFLVGHLLGNLQLIFKTGEEGRRAFNEYAYFMAHNPAIKILSWVTYISILFHAIDGILLTIQNKKARPIPYARNNPSKNSSTPARYMAVLGTLVLVFIATHMANFWYKAKISEEIPMHSFVVSVPDQNGQVQSQEFYYTHNLQLIPKDANFMVKNGTDLYMSKMNIKIGEGYRDLHTVVMQFFSKDNDSALFAVLFYVLSMFVLSFHLWHGFSSAFQSLGLNHKKYNAAIGYIGKGFAVLVPLLFAIIPIIIYLK